MLHLAAFHWLRFVLACARVTMTWAQKRRGISGATSGPPPEFDTLLEGGDYASGNRRSCCAIVPCALDEVWKR